MTVEREGLSEAQCRYLDKREELLRTALEDALCASGSLRQAMRDGHGIWIDSFAPLTPAERTMVLRELKKIWFT